MYLRIISTIMLLAMPLLGQQVPTQPVKTQPGKSALISPAISAKTSRTQLKAPRALPPTPGISRMPVSAPVTAPVASTAPSKPPRRLPAKPIATSTTTSSPQLSPAVVSPKPAPRPLPRPVKALPTTPAPQPPPRAGGKKIEAPQTPKEPFDLKKVIAERKALNKSKALPEVKSDYYTPENLQKLKSQGTPYHLPAMIIIDQNNIECPTCGDNLAMTVRLAAGLLSNQAIICSASTVHNLFYRLKYPSGSWASELQADKFDMSLWQIYAVQNSKFLLFVPTKFKNFFYEALQIKDSNKLSDISNLFSNLKNDNQVLDMLLNINISNPNFSVDNLKKIFISKQTTKSSIIPIWDFIIAGHGSYDLKIVVDLQHEPLNKLLSFFDNEINTGIIALESCYAGGKNLELLQVSQSGINLSHNYILIVCSSTDQVTYGFGTFSDTTKFDNDFFSNSAQLTDKGESLNKIIRDLQYRSFGIAGSPHGGTSSIPQIWLPNGLGFQTLNINNDILPVGKVLIKTHEDEKKPITISKKRAVLIYANSIATPLIVEPVYVETSKEYKTSTNSGLIEQAKESNWKNFAMPTEYLFWKDLNQDQTAQIAKKLEKDIPHELMIDIHWKVVKDYYIFPQFILMRGIVSTYFKEIDIKNPSYCPACGILRFIRDTFFAEKNNPVTKTIYIDSLTGYNDLALILKARNLKNEILGKPSSEDEELIKNLNQPLNLKNIKIFIMNERLTFDFELYDKAWNFDANPNGWKIIPYDLEIEKYRRNYEQDKKFQISREQIDQKSISEVLKLKQQKMLKEKAPSKKAYAPRRRNILMASKK